MRISGLLLLSAGWAQYGVVPDTILYETWLNGNGGVTEMRVFKARGNPRISEKYRRVGPTDWEIVERDTVITDNQGRLIYFSNISFRNSGADSSLIRTQVTYPQSNKGIFISQGWDTITRSWKNLIKVEFHNSFGLSLEVLSGSFILDLVGLREELLPVLYRRSHVGDTIRYYEWDTLLSPPDWALWFAYARKAGTCDSLYEISTGQMENFELCFDGNGNLLRSRDTTAADSSVWYRFVYYDGSRILRDSAEAVNYDGQGAVERQYRKVTRYTYTPSGGFDVIERISLSSRGPFILRRGGRWSLAYRLEGLGRFSEVESSLRLANVDTVIERMQFIYRTAGLEANLFQLGCFQYSSRERMGRFGCLQPQARLSLELYDVMGRQVWQGEVSGAVPTFQLPMSLPAGVYVLRAGSSAQRIFLEP